MTYRQLRLRYNATWGSEDIQVQVVCVFRRPLDQGGDQDAERLAAIAHQHLMLLQNLFTRLTPRGDGQPPRRRKYTYECQRLPISTSPYGVDVTVAALLRVPCTFSIDAELKGTAQQIIARLIPEPPEASRRRRHAAPSLLGYRVVTVTGLQAGVGGYHAEP